MPGTPKKDRPADDPEQSKRFKDAARDAEAEEGEASADAAFRRFVKDNSPAKKK
jgi:hypothetical protein